MPSADETHTLFLASSFDPLTTPGLYGYCFHESDLIVGSEGYAEFAKRRRLSIPPGMDGSYIVTNAIDGTTEIGTDYCGYQTLFYYQNNSAWALSNSFLALGRFLKAKGFKLTLDEGHLSSWFLGGAFGKQLTSLHTCIKEVRLLPATMRIIVDHGGLRTERAPFVQSLDEEDISYDHALRRYIQVWVSRMRTLFRSGIEIHSDLTGGRDSRTNLGLLLAASRSLDSDLPETVIFRSGLSAEADLGIATNLAALYGLRLNEPFRRCPARITARQTYERWKVFNLGIYGPVYLNYSEYDSRLISIGGTGGESHRAFYGPADPEQFLERRRMQFHSRTLFDDFKGDVLNDLNSLRIGLDASLHPMIVHYRHFRDRCHGGRSSRYVFKCSPLASAFLRKASSLCPANRMLDGQVLVDLLQNLDPMLLGVPFDSCKKTPSWQQFQSVPHLGEAAAAADDDGRMFTGETERAATAEQPFMNRSAIEMLCDDFIRHKPLATSSGFFPKNYIEEAAAFVFKAAETGDFGHAIDAIRAVHVILAGEAMRLTDS